MESPLPQPTEALAFDPDAIKRLLEALGEWGVAEQKGLPDHMVSIFAQRAKRAFETIATAA
jgi:hypothetical protein